MGKNKFFAAIALVLAVVTISSVSAFAATDKTTTSSATQENRQEIRAAILAGDYDAWYALVTKTGKDKQVLEVITKDNFAKFSEAHKLMEQSRQIMSDLGIEKGPGKGIGAGMGMGMRMGKMECDCCEKTE